MRALLRQHRWALVALAILAFAAGILASRADAQPAKRGDNGWVCTLSGSIVGAGVGAATAPITGALAGGAWTAGCEVGKSSNDPPLVISGLPRQKHRCWYDLKWVHWHHWRINHQFYLAHHTAWKRNELHYLRQHPGWTGRKPIHQKVCLV